MARAANRWQQRVLERGQRRLRLQPPGQQHRRRAAGQRAAGRPLGGAGRATLCGVVQPAGDADRRAGRIAQAAAAGPAVHCGRGAQRRRRRSQPARAVVRLRQRAACRHAGARRGAGRPEHEWAEGRIRQGRQRPPVRLPQLRQSGDGEAGRIQGHHLPAVPHVDRPEQGHWRRAAPRRTGRAGAPADCAGQRGAIEWHSLAGGRFSAPPGPIARRRRELWLDRIPALQRQARLCVSGRCRRRLEPGAPHHRRAQGHRQRRQGRIRRRHLQPHLELQRRNQLRAGRVLLAGAARPENLQPRLRRGRAHPVAGADRQ